CGQPLHDAGETSGRPSQPVTRLNSSLSSHSLQCLVPRAPKMAWLSTEFYFYKGSAPCRAVWMTLKVLKVDHEEKIVDLLKAENKRPWFIRLNPQHTVPTVSDQGLVLWERYVPSLPSPPFSHPSWLLYRPVPKCCPLYP
ncbi:Glutathione S-transferase 1-like 4, partial [Homarus americanus]